MRTGGEAERAHCNWLQEPDKQGGTVVLMEGESKTDH